MNNNNFIFIYLLALIYLMSGCEHKATTNKLDINYLNYGWSSQYDSISHHIEILKPWGAKGWVYGDENDKNTYFDASEYDKVVIDLEGIKGAVSKLNIVVRYTDETAVSRNLSTIVEGATTMRVDLDPAFKDRVKSIFLMCDSACEMNIKRAYYDKAHKYGKAKELHMSDIGIITSDQFDGYSDDALVEMIFESKGNIMGVNEKGDTLDMTGWEVGIICSAADILGADLPTRGIVLQNIGLQKSSCLLGDIRYLLSLKDDDGECGIFWTVWKTGNITEMNVIGTTIAEVAD